MGTFLLVESVFWSMVCLDCGAVEEIARLHVLSQAENLSRRDRDRYSRELEKLCRKLGIVLGEGTDSKGDPCLFVHPREAEVEGFIDSERISVEEVLIEISWDRDGKVLARRFTSQGGYL